MDLFGFVETVVDQGCNGFESSFLVAPVYLEVQYRAFAGRQHHHRHNTFPINQLTVFSSLNGTGECRRTADKLGRRSRVESQFVDNGDLRSDHELAATAVPYV